MHSESLRYDLARLLVVVSFVWPFINFSRFSPDSTVEINFLFVFIAMALLPSLLFEDVGSSLLAASVIAIASVWGPPSSALRLLIGIAPCLFLFCLYRHYHGAGKELIPVGVAYKALLVFVGFSVLQYINFNFFPIIPEWITSALMVLVPRYADIPYDDSGIRGVQGWASEPSSAAMTCFSFCVVALRQQPEKRWRILVLFAVLAVVNRSVYCMLFLVFLAFACFWHIKSRLRILSAALVFALVFSYFALQTGRVTELREHVVTYGLDTETNHELLRFAQIVYPIASFPRFYAPVNFFELEIQPLGLLPLMVGYGSVLGLLLYCRVMFRNFSLSRVGSKPLAVGAIFLLSCMSSPDFVPAIIALTYSTEPVMAATAGVVDTPAKSWLRRIWSLMIGSPEAIRN